MAELTTEEVATIFTSQENAITLGKTLY